MKKNKYYDYAFNVKGYPDDCGIHIPNSLVFNWEIDLSGVAIIPYKTGIRTVRLEKPDPPNWNNDNLYASKSRGGKSNLVGLLGEMVVMDLLEYTGLRMGVDVNSLNYRINPKSPSKSWGINIPDIEVVEDLDRHYLEVKTSVTNHINIDLNEFRNCVKWCNIEWHKGDFKLIGVEFLELPVNSDYDFVFAFRNAYILPDRSSTGNSWAQYTFTSLDKKNNQKFIPRLRLRNISNLSDIVELLS